MKNIIKKGCLDMNLNSQYIHGELKKIYEHLQYDSLDDLFNNFVLEDGKKLTDENIDIVFDV